ncbi:MAG: AarF/UbiB family protein [Pseudomonadota bacterium]
MFKWLSDYGRLINAGVALARHDVILPGEYRGRLPLPAQLAGRTLRLVSGGASGRPGERLAKALESLGPAYIKLGQFLATRPDVFGVETTDDLSRLKDKLPPFSNVKASEALEKEFGPEAKTLFRDIGSPVAAASLAQVHRMETPEGARAVKILRPNIEKKIENALSAMLRAGRTIEGVSAESRRLRPVAFTETIAVSMRRELDLRLEAGGTDEMRALSEKDGFYRVPSVDWARTGRRVLTTEWIDGKPLTDPAVFDQPHANREEIANKVTRGFLSHAIYHGVFHADMHEGNMILTPKGELALVDFGIIGRIGLDERRFLAEILWGFIQRDYTKVAEVHFEAGYVPADQSVGDFAQALRSVGEPIHGKSAEDVSMGRLLLQLMDFTHAFGMQLRPELVLLQKTMVQVEGVARGIDPNHDIWTAAKPVVEKWVTSAMGPAGAARLMSRNVREVSERLKRLPAVMDKLEERLEAPPIAETQKAPFAPWWGWFGLIIALSGIAVYGVTQVSA